MGKLGPIVCILLGIVNRARDEFPMCNLVTTPLIRHYLPGWPVGFPYQVSEESFCRFGISTGLQKNIDNFTILIHRSPKVALFPSNPDKDLVNEECIPESLMAAP